MQSELFIKQSGRYRPATAPEVCAAASAHIFALAAQTRVSLSSPNAAKQYLAAQAGLDVEQFGIIYLDKRNRVIDMRVMFNGTIDGAAAYPREIVKTALQLGAASVIAFHNHPSMVAEPSTADELITQRLKSALALVDIRFMDHLIVAGRECISLAERGLV
jgi:DNA repair protein RadC